MNKILVAVSTITFNVLVFLLPIFIIVFDTLCLLMALLRLPLNAVTVMVSMVITVLVFWKSGVYKLPHSWVTKSMVVVLLVFILLPSFFYSGKRLGLANGNVDSATHLIMAKQMMLEKSVSYSLQVGSKSLKTGYPFGSQLVIVAPALLLPTSTNPVDRNIIIFDTLAILNALVFAVTLVTVLMIVEQITRSKNNWVLGMVAVFLAVGGVALTADSFTSFWSQSVALMFFSLFMYFVCLLYDEKYERNKAWFLSLALFCGILASWSWTFILPVVLLASVWLLFEQRKSIYTGYILILSILLLLHAVPVITILSVLDARAQVNAWGGVETKSWNSILFWALIVGAISTFWMTMRESSVKSLRFVQYILLLIVAFTIAIWGYQMLTLHHENYYYFKLYQFLFIPLLVLALVAFCTLIERHLTRPSMLQKLLIIGVAILFFIYFYPTSMYDKLYQQKLFYPDANHYNTILALQQEYKDQNVKVIHIDEDFFGKYYRWGLLLDTPRLLNLDESITAKKNNQKESLKKIAEWQKKVEANGEKLIIFDALSEIETQCFVDLVKYVDRHKITVYPLQPKLTEVEAKCYVKAESN